MWTDFHLQPGRACEMIVVLIYPIYDTDSRQRNLSILCGLLALIDGRRRRIFYAPAIRFVFLDSSFNAVCGLDPLSPYSRLSSGRCFFSICFKARGFFYFRFDEIFRGDLAARQLPLATWWQMQLKSEEKICQTR